jgi:opacity protein-like surface antigen
MTIPVARSARRWLAYAVVIGATAAALPMSTPAAVAADMPVQPRPQALAPPLWTGFYIGIHGGQGWGSSRVEDPNFQLAFEPVSIKSTGGLAGAQVGADWQFGSIVVGGELDASWAWVKGSGQDPAFSISGFSTEFRGLVTGTARAGYAVGSVLGYAKGGVAWADIDFKSRIFAPVPLDIEHQRTGLTAGAGLEVLLIGNLSAKIEYDYLYFGATAMSLGSPNGPSNVDHALHVVKAGLNLRFGGDYLAARY